MCMKTRDIVLSAVSVIVWYGFIYYLLMAIKTNVDLYTASLILLVLAAIGTVACPLVNKSEEWKKLIVRKKG